MKSKRTKIFFIAGILVAAAGYFLTKAKQTDIAQQSTPSGQIDYFHIGVLAPLKGEFALQGESIVRGARVAEQLVNSSGGINGKPIKLHIADTRSQAAVAAELAQDLVKRAGVSLIVGGYDEEADLAVANKAPQLNVPYIYLNSGFAKTCSATNNLEASSYVWGMGLTYHMSVEPLLIYLAEILRKPESKFQIYYFGTSGRETEKLIDFVVEAAEALSFDTIEVETIDIRIKDLFRQIREIFRRRPDLLFVLTSSKASPNFITQAAKLGIKAEMPVASLDSFNEEMLTTLGDTADDTITVSRYLNSLENEQNAAFLAAWKKLYPEVQTLPTELAAMSYGSVVIAATALRKATGKATGKAAGEAKANSQPATAESFRVAMQDLEVDLPQGSVLVSASNNLLIQPLYAVKIAQGKFQLAEYLGEVSHPALDSCAIEQIETNE